MEPQQGNYPLPRIPPGHSQPSHPRPAQCTEDEDRLAFKGSKAGLRWSQGPLPRSQLEPGSRRPELPLRPHPPVPEQPLLTSAPRPLPLASARPLQVLPQAPPPGGASQLDSKCRWACVLFQKKPWESGPHFSIPCLSTHRLPACLSHASSFAI